MDSEKNILNVASFVLHSSSEVVETIEQIKTLEREHTLIHIVAYLHNTVLVENLKRGILKVIPDANIVLLKHEDKSKTFVTFFNINKDVDSANISNEILNELHLEKANSPPDNL